MDMFFPFAAGIVFRAGCIAYVSAVNKELNFGRDADSVQFALEAAGPTPISFLEPSVYM